MGDFKGYRRTPPDPKWSASARVAVSFVINFEEGAEMSLSSGDGFNEKVYEVTDEVTGVADRCMESHFEYGTKAAWWRIADTLERLDIRATVSSCGKAAQLSPWLIEDAVRRGHEISCHGWRWEKHALMSADEEREKIALTHRVLSEIAGTPVVGWHTRSTPSPNTRRLLIEHGGFLCDSDDYSDDLPFSVEVAGKQHLVIPYAFDTNDMHYHQGFHRFVSARDFADYTTDAFDTLWAEGETHPKMMSIGLHLRMIGRPGRIAALDRIVNHMKQKGGAWFATRHQIAEHWLKTLG
jgi:allantoinase